MSMIELPWPPKELSPNARVHWAKRSKKAKIYRAACFLVARASGLEVPEGDIILSLEFIPPDRRARDDDNCIAAFKSGRDGIAEGFGIDDNRFKVQVSMRDEPIKNGLVRVRLLPAAVAPA